MDASTYEDVADAYKYNHMKTIELPNEFAARQGAHISDSDANLIGLELRKITKPGTQGPTAAEVVDAASDKSSPPMATETH